MKACDSTLPAENHCHQQKQMIIQAIFHCFGAFFYPYLKGIVLYYCLLVLFIHHMSKGTWPLSNTLSLHHLCFLFSHYYRTLGDQSAS